MDGWIKLHRKILNNCVSSKPEYLAVWIHLLLSANYSEETSFIWNNQKQILKKGQLITGLNKLSKKTGVAQGTVYRILKYLEDEKQIEQQKTTKYTIITILNWHSYQQVENQNEKQDISKKDNGCVDNCQNGQNMENKNDNQNDIVDEECGVAKNQYEKQIENRLKTDRKQIETFKNIKKDKEYKEEIKIPSNKKTKDYVLSDEFFNSLKGHSLFGKYLITKEMVAWKVQAMEDWYSSKGKIIKDWPATCRNWLSRDIEEGKIVLIAFSSDEMTKRFGPRKN